MNNTIREALKKHQSTLEDIKSALEGFQQEEQDKFDNLPEGLQNGEKGELLQNAATALEESCEELQAAVDALDNAIAKVDDATQ